jgi:hypothetical protein
MTEARDTRFSRGLIGVMTTALIGLALTGTANAATYTPTQFSDDNGSEGDCPPDAVAAGCSLREAVKAANATAADDTIVLTAGTYVLDLEFDGIPVGSSESGFLLIRGAGARATTVDANGSEEVGRRAFTFRNASRSELQDLAVTGGYLGEGTGGAIFVDGESGGDASLTLTRTWIHHNQLGFGDGGAIHNNGNLTIRESLISSNTAGDEGGAIENDDVLTLVNSTISGNTANDEGGGIDNDGDASENEDQNPQESLTGEVPEDAAGVFAENSTIANNEALHGNGGGIATEGGQQTFARGAEEQIPEALAVFHNSVVSDNAADGAANCSNNQPKESQWSSSNGYNIEDGETCEFKSTGDLDNTPRLGALDNNGGPTDTHALLEESPAIDAGDPDAAKCEDADQRGVTRFQRNGCDMGAYEAGEVPQPGNEIPTNQLQQQETPRGGDECTDRLPPITTLRASGLTVDSDSVTLVGRSRDRGDPCPSGVQRVEVSMAKVSGTDLNCRFIRSSNRFVITPFRNCRRPILFVARGTTSWRFVYRGVLPRGKYRAQARGYDNERNKETPKKRRNIIVFDVP